ncbi:MAG: polysaccharide deacetylase [Oscillospiraceae bacterium]|nr:polysaccharide deacetylase [Oscillospiraceae bacterium]
MAEASVRQVKKKRRVFLTVLLIVLAVIAAVAAAAVLYDSRHAELSIIGPDRITIEYGEQYTDAGAKAVSAGRIFGELDTHIDVYAYLPVDISELGEHEVRYFCSYLGRSYEAVRTVTVVDTERPVLELEYTGDFNATADKGYIEPGYSAYDNHDGDITSDVIVNISSDMVYYSVSDSSGNNVFAQREILYAPTEPIIELIDGPDITVEASIAFEDPGFKAYDEKGSRVNELVTVEGEITPYLTGEYELTYTLDTGFGAPVVAVRKVTVVAKDVPASVAPAEKTIYLTFDDGPGPYTEQLLDILKKYGVKATFFVTGQNPDYLYLITREYDEGHTVAVHTYSHDIYSKDENNVYSSVEAYYDDFMRMREIIYEKTGYYTNMFRFPGGSSNTLSRFNPGIMTTLTQAMPNMGFKAFDWNVTSGDAEGRRKPEQIKQNVIDGVQSISYGYAVVLQHDIQDFSVAAVEDIIKWGLSNGYKFAALDMTAPRTPHAVFN